MIEMPTDKNPVVIIHGDCNEILPQIPEGVVDAVVTDPPYGVGYKGSTTKHGKNGSVYNSFEDTPENIEKICVPAIRLAVAKARSAIVTPGSANCHLYDVPQSQGAIFYPSGANFGPWGFICSQPLYYYGKDPYLSKGLGCLPNGFSTTESTDRTVNHPCPKPIGQTRWMVRRVSLPSEIILDPFAGSGTTGVAAVLEGRKCILIEKDARYVEVIRKRIKHALCESPSQLPFKHPTLLEV